MTEDMTKHLLQNINGDHKMYICGYIVKKKQNISIG